MHGLIDMTVLGEKCRQMVLAQVGCNDVKIETTIMEDLELNPVYCYKATIGDWIDLWRRTRLSSDSAVSMIESGIVKKYRRAHRCTA